MKLNVKVTIADQYGFNNHVVWNISRQRLASAFFRVSRRKGIKSNFYISLEKSLIVYSLLRNGQIGWLQSAEYQHCDPTEKGVYSYYLGMATCKLVSERQFHVPFLKNYSLVHNQINVKATGNYVPDLIWYSHNQTAAMIFEAKGSSGPLDTVQLKKGVKQVQNFTIKGNPVKGIVTESYFYHGLYSIWIEDPEGNGACDLEYDETEHIKNYYQDLIEVLNEQKSNPLTYRFTFAGQAYTVVVGLDEHILELYNANRFEVIKEYVMNKVLDSEEEGISLDGIRYEIIEERN